MGTAFLLDVPNRVHLVATKEVVTSDTHGTNLTMRNNSLSTIYYGSYFQLEKWDEDSSTWYIYDDKPVGPFPWDLGLRYVRPLSIRVEGYGLYHYSNHFETGLYRIVQEVEYGKPSDPDKPQIHDSKKLIVYGEFTIADE